MNNFILAPRKLAEQIKKYADRFKRVQDEYDENKTNKDYLNERGLN